ncbi:MAG: exodeoxyribonuclease VII large subunit [Bacteroidia bacterium]|nr:exodeoxyribonuclease VII large subunit [Bacteroidia bacterium]
MEERLSLTELQLIIKDSLYMALPDMYWVIAEISEMKENYAGHCYLELIEKHPDEKNARARIKAVIWNKKYNFLRSLFENITGEQLREGMKVLVRTKVEYHELYGLSLIISDIDPSFTMGEMALKRQMIIKRLEEEGVFTMNKELFFPLLPQRIAVISSKGAAGYSDFINHLTKNSFGYIFYTALFETVMQGSETEQSVINSLDRIAAYPGMFDVVAIIRGGGSQSDLSWFDNYNIAYYVTQFPLPVITGIGHEKDLSVTDMVAFQSLRTPTAVADHLIDCVANTESHLEEISNEMSDTARLIIDDNRNRLETFRMKLIPVAKLMISDNKENLSEKLIELINFGKEYIVKAGLIPANHKSRLISATGYYSTVKNTLVENMRHELISRSKNFIEKISSRAEILENKLMILDPVNVLKRGYTITTCNNMVIKSVVQVSENDLIDTRFSDGSIKSKVIQKK